MKTLVIIPAYNEAALIKSVVERLVKECPDFDYVVINDCSTDNTLKILRENGIRHLNLPVNLGIGGAVQTGYIYAKENDYDIAIQMDGDGQHNPKYYKTAVELIENKSADYVIGSRFIENEGFQTSTLRRIGIKFLSILINLVCGQKVKDVTSGYRIINRKCIEMFVEDYAQDYPEPEAIIKAKLNGAAIKEIPVVMEARLEGESSISPLKSILYMVKVSLAIILYRATM